jgi:hypothetical protein
MKIRFFYKELGGNVANVKRCFIALAFCLSLLFQWILNANEFNSSDSLNRMASTLVEFTSELLLSTVNVHVILSNNLFGVDVSGTEKLGLENLLPPLVLPIAGYFAVTSIRNLLKSILNGNISGVINNAKMIGYSGLATLAAGFAVNDKLVTSFIESSLSSMGMISGMTSAVSSVLSGMLRILDSNANTVALQETASKKIMTSIDIQDTALSADQMTKEIARIINTILPPAIEERISALINREVEGVEFFPTPKEKIWALQNIEDFLVFPYGLEEKGSQKEKEAKNLNPYIYKIIMEKIRELQSQLMVAVDENGNEIWIDKNENNKAIDGLCEQYRKNFNISVATLKNMEPNVLDQKIGNIRAALNKIKDSENSDNEKKALISILYHLSYKKINQKQAVLIEKTLKNAQAQVAAASQYVEKAKSQFPEDTVIKEIEKPKSSGWMAWLRERFFTKKHPQVIDVGDIRSMQKVEPKPVQQRGRFSSWLNRWFGGR